MIQRYTLPEMGAVWSELEVKKRWHNVECAVLNAKEELGMIPEGISKLARKVHVTKKLLKRAAEIEKTTDHDLIAFVLAVAEKLDDRVKPYYHAGLTSYDVEDTALGLTMAVSLMIIDQKLRRLQNLLAVKAQEHRKTVMIGRTHGIHGEPITFGIKILNWLDVIQRHLKNLNRVREEVSVGKISGAMGVHVLDPRIEVAACRQLGLDHALISTQVISRDRHVRYTAALVQIANSLDKFATEIRHLAGTDIGEVAEFKRPGNKGSSAMPGKSRLRNPIKSENVSGLAKVMRGYVHTSLECEVLWNERSLDNSSAERIYFPDTSILLDFMLNRFTDTLEKLEVYPEQMMRNLWKTGGIVFAQRVMLALTEKGMARHEAYNLVEQLALSVQPGTFVNENGETFKDLVLKNPEIAGLVAESDLINCFDPEMSLKYVDTIYARFRL